MRTLVPLLWLLLSPTRAGEWSDQPIDPKSRPSDTAYTVGKQHWQLGLVHQRYGLLQNTQIGTTAPLWLLGVANAQAKVTAIQTPKFDVAIDGAAYHYDLDPLGVPNGALWVTPVGWTASWVLGDHLGAHFGTAWTIAEASGSLQVPQLADGIEAVTGADLSADLERLLGDEGGLYGGANLTLFQTRLGFDLRLNRRDSIVLHSNTYVMLSGLVAAGVDVQDATPGGAEVQAGASARFRVPLTDTISSFTTLSWLFQWRHTNLRVGIPLPVDNVFAYFQAFDLYWVLGPSRKRVPSPPAAPGQAAPVDTGTEDEPGDEVDTGDPGGVDTGL